MTVDDVINHFGPTQPGAAQRLGVTSQALSYWRRAGIPMVRQYQIEVLSGGKLRADRPSPTEPEAAA